MKTRGEKQYINMPRFAAKLYDNLTGVKGVNKSFEEIAVFIGNSVKQGYLLDVGTGPGRLLLEIHKNNSLLDLYGLDISASMLDVAKQNLKAVKNVNLQVGNITGTDYPANFFDCIVTTGSFYNWDKPVEGLNEIFRILKQGKSAYIFDTYKEYDKSLLKARLKENLKDYSIIRKFLSKPFLKKQLSITYSITEYENIIRQSVFKENYTIHQIDLGNLPVWLRIELRKD
ncbi:MAG: class I SAM-dependent methyltransferase [Bacteroidia bacterium]|nr:class I SAM-dependent methyltransferase [Bacteroidia bacterium]